jgi:hypothetical protein
MNVMLRSRLWTAVIPLITVAAFMFSCAAPKQDTQLDRHPPRAKKQMVAVTIEGDVRVPGVHSIEQNCDIESIRRAVGGWSSKRDEEQTGMIFYLYRNIGGVTNRQQMHFWDLSTHAPKSCLVDNGDRIVVKRVIY